MPIKVLVFESDTAFASELRNELGRLGCAVRVVDDGNVGLQQAQAERPDLVLLSIELPRMNGFSVCNKLKKDPELKEIPLIIMSSESSDETFEQHKKLRTRAEAYVHKPIAFDDLLVEITQFVPIEPLEETSVGERIPVIDVDVAPTDDDFDEGAGTEIHRRSFFPDLHARVDPEIDSFADDVFGRLEAGAPDAAAANAALTEAPAAVEPRRSVPPTRPTQPPMTPVRASQPPPSNGAAARTAALIAEGQEHAKAATARAAELEEARAELDRVSGELQQATARAGALEKQLRDAESTAHRAREEAEAEAQNLKHDLDELKTRLSATASPARGSIPPKAGGVSSREFLDLRETLSKKDKEILALKTQLTAKDKEIFETRDRSLGYESRVSELDDKVLAKDRELTGAEEQIEELSGELESTKKRLADTETEAARVDAELAALRTKREQDNVAHESTITALRAEVIAREGQAKEEGSRALAEAEASFKAASETASAKHAAEAEEARTNHAAELRAVQAQHKAELEDARTKHATELQQVRTQHAEALDEARAQHATEIERLRSDHGAALRDADSRHTAASLEAAARHAKETEEAETAHATELEDARSKHMGEMQEARTSHAAALEGLRVEGEKAKLAAVAAREATLREETDAKLSLLQSGHEEELSRVRNDADAKEASLRADLARTSERLADIEKQLAEVTAVRMAVTSQLASTESKVAALEEELTSLRAELDATRKNLVKESSRATRAHAKWDADRASLERAKDALAVALTQLDEAESRQLTD